MDLPDFPRLLNQFEAGIKYQELLSVHKIDFDTFAYEIETNIGPAIVFEIDYIYGLESIQEQASKIGSYQKFIPVKKPLNFVDAQPVKVALKYREPNNWDEIRIFANDKFGSSGNYFSFLLI